jgi:hypothetical protein
MVNGSCKENAMRKKLIDLAKRIGGGLRTLSPYLAVELILPGGSLIALALWLYNRKHAST